MDLAGCSGCLQDNFTDVNGTSLGSHVPDGGSVPFSWQLTNSDPTVAQIQNNAVGYDQGGGWIYLTSVNAGDAAQVQVDVFAQPVDQTDVGVILRANPGSSTFYKGYTITWLIYGSGLGSDISIDRQDTNLLLQPYSASPTSTGLHTLRADVLSGGLILVYVDDVLAATVTDPNPLPPGRDGISIFNGGPTSAVRITSFVAAPGCAPTGDPLLDDPAVRQGLSDELSLSRPNPDGSGRTERRGYLYQKSDGTYLLVPANDPTGSMCGFTFKQLPTPPIIDGATFIGDYHTHPSKHRERLTGCPGEGPNDIWWANRKAKTGGGSEEDWNFADARRQSDSNYKAEYVVDIDGNVWRLDPGTLTNARKNNPNHWKFSGSTGCLERA